MIKSLCVEPLIMYLALYGGIRVLINNHKVALFML